MTESQLILDREKRALGDCMKIRYGCYELGLLTVYTGILANVIELTPALTIGAAEVDQAVEILDEALTDVEAGRFDDAKLAPFGGW